MKQTKDTGVHKLKENLEQFEHWQPCWRLTHTHNSEFRIQNSEFRIQNSEFSTVWDRWRKFGEHFRTRIKIMAEVETQEEFKEN